MPRYSDKSGGNIAGNASYHLVRRAQARVAGQQHFTEDELYDIRERDSFLNIARICRDKYFHHSEGLQVSDHISELYIDVLVMAPILHKISHSMKFDWSKGQP